MHVCEAKGSASRRRSKRKSTAGFFKYVGGRATLSRKEPSAHQIDLEKGLRVTQNEAGRYSALIAPGKKKWLSAWITSECRLYRGTEPSSPNQLPLKQTTEHTVLASVVQHAINGSCKIAPTYREQERNNWKERPFLPSLISFGSHSPPLSTSCYKHGYS